MRSEKRFLSLSAGTREVISDHDEESCNLSDKVLQKKYLTL